MNLDEQQKSKVTEWIAQGANVSEVQKKLDGEFGIRMTYMEVRLLMDDLKLVPKDPERKKEDAGAAQPSNAAAPGKPTPKTKEKTPLDGTVPPSNKGVTVSVDQITRPGSLVSGKVTFSDGKSAEWYLDQLGRLGLIPKEEGYKPSTQDIQAFQKELQSELQRLGL